MDKQQTAREFDYWRSNPALRATICILMREFGTCHSATFAESDDECIDLFRGDEEGRDEIELFETIAHEIMQAAQAALTPALVEARDALQKAYAMLVKANLKEHSEENQRCGRCDYCEALLPNADDDDCGECYGIVQALARLNAIIGDKK